MPTIMKEVYWGSILDDYVDRIVEAGKNQPIPVIMKTNGDLNFTMFCTSMLHRLQHDMESDEFDTDFVKTYQLEYYSQRGETERKAIHFTQEINDALNAIDVAVKKQQNVWEQYVMKGDLFARRTGVVNMSYILPLAIMWLYTQIQSIEPETN